MFVLVDWMDESDVTPVYGIVKVDTAVYGHIAWRPGDDIFIRTRHSAPRLAMIVQTSERRRYIKKQKALLEKQDRQVNNVLQSCTQPLNERSSEDPSNFMGARRNSRNFNKFTPTFNSRHNRMPSVGTQLRNAMTENSSRRRSIVCCTPLPSSSSQQFRSLTINRATQTDMSFRPILKRIEMLEETASNLNRQLLSMMPQATTNPSTAESNSIEHVQQSGRSSSPGFVVEAILAEDTESSTGSSIGVDQGQNNSSNASNFNIGEDQEQHNSSNDFYANIGADQEQHNNSNDSNANIGADQEQHNSSNDSNADIGADQEQHNNSDDSNANIGADQDQHNSSNDSNADIGADQEQHNNSDDSNANIGADQDQHNSSNDSNANIGADQELHNNSNYSNSKIRRICRVSAQTTNTKVDLVPLGDSHVAVHPSLLNEIEWKSHTKATRQLLRAIFSRRVLATSSLSGKPSPRFSNMNKPVKKKLNPSIVKDIVTMIATRCGKPRNEVRKNITNMCSDEAKLLRIRQRRRQLRQSRNNEENMPPSTSSSDENHGVMNII